MFYERSGYLKVSKLQGTDYICCTQYLHYTYHQRSILVNSPRLIRSLLAEVINWFYVYKVATDIYSRWRMSGIKNVFSK